MSPPFLDAGTIGLKPTSPSDYNALKSVTFQAATKFTCAAGSEGFFCSA